MTGFLRLGRGLLRSAGLLLALRVDQGSLTGLTGKKRLPVGLSLVQRLLVGIACTVMGTGCSVEGASRQSCGNKDAKHRRPPSAQQAAAWGAKPLHPA